jgi:hypothetical protein
MFEDAIKSKVQSVQKQIGQGNGMIFSFIYRCCAGFSIGNRSRSKGA